jgi:fibro-slime domain-containing protein
MRAFKVVAFALSASSLLVAGIISSNCSPSSSGPTVGAGGKTTPHGGTNQGSAGGESGGGGAGLSFTLSAPALGGATGDTKPVAVWPPVGFKPAVAVTYGEYSLGPLVTDYQSSAGGTGGNSGGPGQCSGLLAVIRDFKAGSARGIDGGTANSGHPDFERPPQVDDRGIVTESLSKDEKPIYAKETGTTKTTSGKESFDQWYRDVPDVNMAYVIAFKFEQNGKVFTFAASKGNYDAGAPDSSYFPLDGVGFGNEKNKHNYHFTTEIHTTFTYNGGEVFTFQGDDDVWVYINGHRAIDLGGIHSQETQTINLDAQASKLEITQGQVYKLAVFNAERHTTESNFRIDTTMVFEDCGYIPIP